MKQRKPENAIGESSDIRRTPLPDVFGRLIFPIAEWVRGIAGLDELCAIKQNYNVLCNLKYKRNLHIPLADWVAYVIDDDKVAYLWRHCDNSLSLSAILLNSIKIKLKA